MSMVVVENGEIYAPKPLGKGSLLLAGGQILGIGEKGKISGDALAEAARPFKAELETIDAKSCYVFPGLIDPHQHLTGGSGEEGYASQSPPLTHAELALSGVTTVVGCLGVDARMKTLPDLLGRVKALKENGFSAYAFTGGYEIPPATLLGSVRDDIIFIEEVIGAGEVAIADVRSAEPTCRQLAKVVSQSYIAGTLSRKAGVVHFHVGEGKKRLQILRSLLEDYEVKAESLYPTHIERGEKLMREGIELAKCGATVDMDTVEGKLVRWLKFYRDEGGDLDRLTVSSDADSSSPETRLACFREALTEKVLPIEKLLPLFTSNIARTLKLKSKGRLESGRDADVLVVKKDTLEIRHLIANGRWLIRNGKVEVREKFLDKSSRKYEVRGSEREEKVDAKNRRTRKSEK
jgi:beta-aspartyl-dipeptidase (metallo-type)